MKTLTAIWTSWTYRRWYSYAPYVIALLVPTLYALHMYSLLPVDAAVLVAASTKLMVGYLLIGGLVAAVAIVLTWLILRSIYKHHPNMSDGPSHVIQYLGIGCLIVFFLTPSAKIFVHMFVLTNVDEDEFFVSTTNHHIVDASPTPGYYFDKELVAQSVTVLPYNKLLIVKVNGADRDSHRLHLKLRLVPNSSYWDYFVSHSKVLDAEETNRFRWIEKLAKEWLDHNEKAYWSMHDNSPVDDLYEFKQLVSAYLEPHLANTGMILEDVRVKRTRY